MKKVFVVDKLESENLQNSLLKKSLIVAYRKDNKLFYQNIEFHPKAGGSINFEPMTGDLVIRVKLRNGDFLAIGDYDGVAEKGKIEK